MATGTQGTGRLHMCKKSFCYHPLILLQEHAVAVPTIAANPESITTSHPRILSSWETKTISHALLINHPIHSLNSELLLKLIDEDIAHDIRHLRSCGIVSHASACCMPHTGLSF
jgi:hypothetical protein